MRRFLTLLPLYFVLFFIGNYIIPYLGVGNNYHAVNVFSPLRYFTFTFNFGYIETWNVFEGIIGNMWSVAAIIQILLLWPLLMGFFRRNEVFLYLLIFIAFVVFAWFFKAEPSRMNKEGLTDYNAFTFNTFRVLFDFMIGSYIAYFSFFKYETYSFLKKTTKRLIGGIYLAFFAYMIFSNRILFNLSSQFPSALLFLADKIVVSVCLGFFLFEQNYSSNSIFKLAKLKFLKVTELYMYGIYCFLPIGAFCGFKLMTFISDDQTMPMVLIVQPILGFFVTIVLAVISYEFIEKSFIKLKKEYQPTREYAPTLGPDVKT
jgi:peptidoglycan/LPS O-acetylase OafA/YrhL